MRSRMLTGVLTAIFAATMVAASPSADARVAGVRMTAIYFDSSGADTGSNSSLNAEWVLIKNFTSRRKTLTGWTLRDAQLHVFHFPTFRLAAGASVKVHTGRGTNTASNLYWQARWYIWNNTGDTATLKNASGTVIDTCHFTKASRPKAAC